MVKFTKRGLWTGIKVFITLFLLNFFVQQASAQVKQLTIDKLGGGTLTHQLNGTSALEWVDILKSNDPDIIAKTFRRDANNTNDDQWTGGSQDPDLAKDWYWVSGNTNDKGDISNAGVVMIGKTIFFFGDRTAINGDAQIAFWFFLGGIAPGDVPGKGGYHFTGTNTKGDVLGISNFINGGGSPALVVYERQSDLSLALDGAKTWLAVNKETITAPNTTSLSSTVWPFTHKDPISGATIRDDWTFTPKSGANQTYPSPLFFEGSIDFTSVQNAQLCFTNFLLETRNSQSLTASLQDFVAGQFDVTPKSPTAEGQVKCLGSDLVFTATCTSGGSTPRWYDVATGGTPLGDGSSYTLKAPSLGDHTLYVSCYNATTGCESTRTKVTGTIYQVTCTTTWLKDVTCYGESNGSASVTPSGGYAPYSYLWDNGEITQTATKLNAGKHTVTVKDKYDCATTCDVTIKQPDELKCTVAKISDVTCYGLSDGSAKVTATGGTTPYSYLWDNGETTQTATKLNAGKHTVTVTDANKCTTTCDVTISQPDELKVSCAVTKQVTCAGADGEITATATGGTTPYSYQLNGGTAQTSNVFSNLGTGDYTIKVTDKNGCTATFGTCSLVAPQCAHIFPTQTTCCNYLFGNTSTFQQKQVCTTVSGGTITNVIPGVFFYYGDYTPSANGPVNISIKQTTGLNHAFDVQGSNQAWVYVDACQSTTFTSSISGPNASVSFYGQAGHKYVISVKYAAKSIQGFSIPSGTAYQFGMYLNGTTLLPNSVGELKIVAGCSDNTGNATGSCPSTVTASDVVPELPSSLSVTAVPNPFNDQVRFTIESPLSGQGTLELFNMLGQKVQTVYEGYLQAGRAHQIEYKVPVSNRENLIYILRIGDQKVTGKLINRR